MTRKGRTTGSEAFAPWTGSRFVIVPAGRAGGGGDLDERRAPGRAGGITCSRQSVGGEPRSGGAVSRHPGGQRWSELSIDPADPKQVRVRVAVDSTVRLQRPGVGAALAPGLPG